jgi:hypothetical protein
MRKVRNILAVKMNIHLTEHYKTLSDTTDRISNGNFGLYPIDNRCVKDNIVWLTILQFNCGIFAGIWCPCLLFISVASHPKIIVEWSLVWSNIISPSLIINVIFHLNIQRFCFSVFINSCFYLKPYVVSSSVSMEKSSYNVSARQSLLITSPPLSFSCKHFNVANYTYIFKGVTWYLEYFSIMTLCSCNTKGIFLKAIFLE